MPEGGVDLFLAAELGRLDEIDRALALDDEPSVAREHDARGSTALHGAC